MLEQRDFYNTSMGGKMNGNRIGAAEMISFPGSSPAVFRRTRRGLDDSAHLSYRGVVHLVVGIRI